jgi:RNA polymerase sigma-70 factor (ECF subfamily)
MLIDIEELYKKYGSMVMRRCRTILKNEESALQAMQDVFVKVLRSGNRLDMRYPSSLLYRIATNTCLNILRDNRVEYLQSSKELINQIAIQETSEKRIIDQSITETIFAKEKESTRVIAYLFYVDGLSWQEIAQTVGLSVSGVRKRMRVFKEKMQKQKEVYCGN